MRGPTTHAKCLDCGHVGDRAFGLAEDGYYRDVLGGDTGLRVDHCPCSRCDSYSFVMVFPPASTDVSRPGHADRVTVTRPGPPSSSRADRAHSSTDGGSR